MTEITFDLVGAYVCSECGATVSDWHESLPNQTKHRDWHLKLEKNIKMSSLGFGPTSLIFP